MKSKLYFDCLQLCSGHFLCKIIPNNWNDLTEEQQIEFIEENTWEPLAHEEGEVIINHIKDAADVTYDFIHSFVDVSIGATN